MQQDGVKFCTCKIITRKSTTFDSTFQLRITRVKFVVVKNMSMSYRTNDTIRNVQHLQLQEELDN